MGQTKERQSNFELLRIISMALIVIHHFAYHGKVDLQAEVTQTSLALQFLAIGGTVGVNVFIMIGSYFLIGKDFHWRRVLKIVFDVILYSYLIMLVYAILKPDYLHGQNLFQMLMPFPGTYWFAGFYVLLILFTPGLNLMINYLSKGQLKMVLLLISVFLIVGPSLMLYDLSLEFKRLFSFIFMYLVTAYIKLYLPDRVNNKTTGRRLTLATYLILLALMSLIFFTKIEFDSGAATDVLLSQNKIFIVAMSIGLFLWFKNMDMPVLKWVNALAGSTFGVYLIHDQPLLRNTIWRVFANDALDNNLALAFLRGLVEGLLVFTICLIVSYLIDSVLGRLTNWSARNLGSRLDDFGNLL